MDNPNMKAHAADCPYCKKANQPEGASLENCAYCQKIDESMLDVSADCPYCAAMDDSGNLASCPYCADMDISPNAAACSYCADMAHRDQECQYCGEGPSVNLPTTTDSQDYAGQGLTPPDLAKPFLGDSPPEEQVTPMDDTTNNNMMLDGIHAPAAAESQYMSGEAGPQAAPAPASGLPPSVGVDAGPAESVQVDQSKEAMMDIAAQIGGTQPTPGSAEQEYIQTDDTATAGGTNMQDNVSRPGGYEDNTPSDLGLGEENQDDAAPDLTSVLQGGLDSQADAIKREKVVQMVAGALSGFKASKQIIERAQTQAPQLYQSSILMLKAMIEMAKMLGLGPSPEQPMVNPLDPAQGVQPQSEIEQMFPTHPDNGGVLMPEHAPAAGSASKDGDANSGNEWHNPFPTHPENGGTLDKGSVGQPVGKLPTAATTQHVTRVPQMEGGVNALGQKKVTDPETGKVRFIDMKEGRVQSSTGVPVKPSSKV